MRKKLLPSMLIFLPVCLFVGYLCIFDGVFHASFDTFRAYCTDSPDIESDQIASKTVASNSFRFMDPILIENELRNIDYLKQKDDSEWDLMEKEVPAVSGLSGAEPDNSDAEIYYVVIKQEN